jgi:hypothetical protein
VVRATVIFAVEEPRRVNPEVTHHRDQQIETRMRKLAVDRSPKCLDAYAETGRSRGDAAALPSELDSQCGQQWPEDRGSATLAPWRARHVPGSSTSSVPT